MVSLTAEVGKGLICYAMDTAKREVFLVPDQGNILCKHLILVYNPRVLAENKSVRDPIIQFFVYMLVYYCYYFIDVLTSVT